MKAMKIARNIFGLGDNILLLIVAIAVVTGTLTVGVGNAGFWVGLGWFGIVWGAVSTILEIKGWFK